MNWTAINGSPGAYFQSANIWGIGNSEIESGLVIGGSQHNGVLRRKNDSWIKTGGGDMGDIAIHPYDENIMFSYQWPGVRIMLRSTDQWGSTSQASSPAPAGIDDYNPILEYNSNGELYVATNEISVLNSSGNGWVQVSDFLNQHNVDPKHKISAFSIYENNPDIMYVAFKEIGVGAVNRLFQSYDKGTTWVDRTPPNNLACFDFRNCNKP